MSSIFAGVSEVNGEDTIRSSASTVRVACIAVATYDFLLTLPAEWRIYRGPRGQYFLRTSALLFFLVRYTSVILLITGSYIFWQGAGLSVTSCSRISLIPSIFKCLQAMVVQLIMGWRTHNLSGQHKPVLYCLTCLYFAVISVQWFSTFYGRTVMWTADRCGINAGTIQWAFYLCCVIWDAVALFVSLFFLSRIRTTSAFMTKLRRTMLVDGLVYFVAMTAVNALNMLIFLKTTQTIMQSSVVVAYTAAMILGQRILINLSDSASENSNSTTNRTRTVTISVSHSAEELGMEVSSQIRSAQQQVEGGPRNPGQRYRGRVRGTVQNTSGEVFDSVIEIDVAPVKTTTDEAGQSGPSREREYHGDDDSLFDFPTDSGIDTNRASFPRRNEGPLMTTRRF